MDWIFSLAFVLLLKNSSRVLFPLSHARGLLGETLELFWQIFLLLFFYLLFVSWAPLADKKEPLLFFLLPGSFFLNRLRKQPDLFCLSVFSLGFWCLEGQDMRPSFWPLLCAALKQETVLILIFFLFRAVLLGLKAKLVFSAVPPRLSGIPILLIAAALSLWIFSGLQPILP